MSKLKSLQKQVKLFEKEVLFNDEHHKLDIQSIFIDHKEKDRRAIVIIGKKGKISKLTSLMEHYFKAHTYKIVRKEEPPQLTNGVQTGRGVRHINATGWGTLGGIFNRANDSATYGLSNNHVLARLNNCNVGDPIVYESNAVVGTLFNWFQLQLPPKINKMDAALFKIGAGQNPSWVPPKPSSGNWIGPKINMKVVKNGLATGLTEGVIKSYNGSAKINFEGQIYNFSGIMSIQGLNGVFNNPGDSGSVILSKSGNYMVGLVFAKHNEYCWALPISRIKPLLTN